MNQQHLDYLFGMRDKAKRELAMWEAKIEEFHKLNGHIVKIKGE